MNRSMAHLVAACFFVAVYACGGEKSSPLICTPGENTKCVCAAGGDGTPIKAGTRKCRADGKSFGSCHLSELEECPFGEVGPDGGVIGGGGGGAGDVDSCPGVAFTIQGSAVTTIHGDTTNAEDNDSAKVGSCGGGGAPDVVYKLIPSETGRLSADLIPDLTTDGDWSPSMYLREGSCSDREAELGCAAGGSPGAHVTLTNRSVVKGREYWLIVDGAAGQKNKGPFQLDISLVPGPVCGDGTVDANEACDDGNHVDNDGCSVDCKGISGNPTSAGSCPGQPVHIWGKTSVSGSGATDRAKWPESVGQSTFTGTNGSCELVSGAGSNDDHVYAVTMHAPGNLLVKVSGATFDTQIIGRKLCSEAASQKTSIGGKPVNRCANDHLGDTGDEQLCIGGAIGETYYVAVDSNNNNGLEEGSYTISFQSSNCIPKVQ